MYDRTGLSTKCTLMKTGFENLRTRTEAKIWPFVDALALWLPFLTLEVVALFWPCWRLLLVVDEMFDAKFGVNLKLGFKISGYSLRIFIQVLFLVCLVVFKVTCQWLGHSVKKICHCLASSEAYDALFVLKVEEPTVGRFSLRRGKELRWIATCSSLFENPVTQSLK